MIRLIGDIHGYYNKYIDIVRGAEYSIQLGDLGFNYNFIEPNIDTSRHKMFGGNHDNYDTIDEYSGYLGRFGIGELNGTRFMWCGGAGSIDKKYRTLKKDWWPQEEMGLKESQDFLSLYKEHKPSLMLSHTAPRVVVDQISNPEILQEFGLASNWSDNTSHVLQAAWEIHQPDRYFFGHFHQSWKQKIGPTEFQCLNINEYVDIK